MKFLAYKEKERTGKVITIYDVIKGRNSKYPKEWKPWEEGVVYYPLWGNGSMKAVIGERRRPHFAYIGNYGQNNVGGGESIEHELSKKIISEMGVLKIKSYGQTYGLPVVLSTIENPFNYEGENYRIDVLLEVGPCAFTEYHGTNRVGIEIINTSKTKTGKKQSVRHSEENIALIDLDLDKEIKLNTELDVERLYGELENYWRGVIPGKCHHHPLKKQRYLEHKIKKDQQEKEERRKKLEQAQKAYEAQQNKLELELKEQRIRDQQKPQVIKPALIEPTVHKIDKSKGRSIVIVMSLILLLFVLIRYILF